MLSAPIISTTTRNFHYEDTGGSGPVIVFSHGFLMDRTMFASQVAALKAQYRCISWDQRGHGLTATGRLSPFNFYDSANDLSDLLSYLNIEKAILVGMSQGGFLTLRCALTNPDVVSALILIDTEAGVMPPPTITGNQGLLAEWIKDGFDAGLQAKITGEIIGPTEPGWDGQSYWTALWAATRFVNLVPSFNALIQRDDISSLLSTITQKALVIHGELDAAVPIADGIALAKGLPNSTFVEIPGAGHASCLTHSDLVNPAILKFLSQLGN